MLGQANAPARAGLDNGFAKNNRPSSNANSTTTITAQRESRSPVRSHGLPGQMVTLQSGGSHQQEADRGADRIVARHA